MYRLSRIKYWFLNRFHPKYRHHILKLGPPGYRDPRHQLVLACMEVLNRYIMELKYIQDVPKDVNHPARVVMFLLERDRIEYEKGVMDGEEEYWEEYWDRTRNHYLLLLEVLVWWEEVKDSDLFDFYDAADWKHQGAFKTKEEFDKVSVEGIDKMLKKIIDLREGMWT